MSQSSRSGKGINVFLVVFLQKKEEESFFFEKRAHLRGSARLAAGLGAPMPPPADKMTREIGISLMRIGPLMEVAIAAHSPKKIILSNQDNLKAFQDRFSNVRWHRHRWVSHGAAAKERKSFWAFFFRK